MYLVGVLPVEVPVRLRALSSRGEGQWGWVHWARGDTYGQWGKAIGVGRILVRG